jgi:hypothetical protein
MTRETGSLIPIHRQLGHSSLGITSLYLQGTDSAEIDRDRPRPRASRSRRCPRTQRRHIASGTGTTTIRFDYRVPNG